jgi:hypothetical protein
MNTDIDESDYIVI